MMKNRAKKALALAIACAVPFALAACGNAVSGSSSTSNTTAGSSAPSQSASSSSSAPPTENSGAASSVESPQANMSGSNILVAYFSLAGEQYNVGVIEEGNTSIIAGMIADSTGGELFEIEPMTPYPEDHSGQLEIAQQERNDGARPEIAASIESMDAYDTIFIGYPIWWGDMPMIVYHFLESYDFAGKTIVPFSTHEGGGLAGTDRTIADICPDSVIAEGFTIRGQTAQEAREEAQQSVVDWLANGGYLGE